MKKLLLASMLLLLPFEAEAAARYASTKLSCNQVQQIAQSRGEAVMRWSSRRDPSLPLYVRIVANRFYCGPNEFAGLSYVPTRDAANCPVKICKGIRQFAPFDPFGYNILN